MPNTFSLIASSTVGAGQTAAAITFSSIPQTYTDLVLKVSLRETSSAFAQNHKIIINGSTSGYSDKLVLGNGASTLSAQNSGAAGAFASFQYSTAAGATADTFANGEFYFTNYTGSQNKSVSYDGVTENNATSAIGALTAVLWSNSAAITSLSVASEDPTKVFVAYSSAYLYGIVKS